MQQLRDELQAAIDDRGSIDVKNRLCPFLTAEIQEYDKSQIQNGCSTIMHPMSDDLLNFVLLDQRYSAFTLACKLAVDRFESQAFSSDVGC